MKPSTKTFLLNFLSFAVLFIVFRLISGYFLEDSGRLVKALAAAVLASILAPKFGAVKTDKGYKIMMKWIFLKGVKEI